MAYSDKTFFLTKIDQAELDNITKQDDTNLIAAIETADAKINSYLQSRFTVLPLTNPPNTIKECSADIAIYNMYSRVAPNNVAELVVKRFDDAIKYLKDIQRGDVQLFPEVAENNSESFIYHGGFDTVMTRKG